MKKEIAIGCALLCASSAVSLQAKTVVYDDCAFCGGGVAVFDDEPEVFEDDPGPSSGCAFCDGYGYYSGSSSYSGGESSSSSWNSGTDWSKATSKKTYIVDGDGGYAGTATISTGKKSKKGKVSVKIAFKLSSGKSATASSKSFTPDEDGVITANWSSVKNVGAVSMVITPDGDVSGTAGSYEFADEYETADSDDEEKFTHGAHTFSVDSSDYVLPNGYDLIEETVPYDASIVTSGSKSWNCGKTPSIKYKKVKEDGETFYELVGFDDETRMNYSGLKLKYNSKKGTFSGSFKVYATNEASIEKGKPKLKSYTFSVSGRISGSGATGVAVCKKLKASWPIVIE